MYSLMQINDYNFYGRNVFFLVQIALRYVFMNANK